MQMAVLRSSALRRLLYEQDAREKQTHAGLVGIVLTSVICVCLSGTRQHHRREADTLPRGTALKPILYLKGGGEQVYYGEARFGYFTMGSLSPIMK